MAGELPHGHVKRFNSVHGINHLADLWHELDDVIRIATPKPHDRLVFGAPLGLESVEFQNRLIGCCRQIDALESCHVSAVVI